MRIILIALTSLILHTGYAQEKKPEITVDPTNFVITQVTLKDGRIIRGRIIEAVRDTRYVIKTRSGQEITFFDEEIVEIAKVIPDKRDLKKYYGFGLLYLNDIASPLELGNTNGAAIHLNTAYELSNIIYIDLGYSIGQLFNMDRYDFDRSLLLMAHLRLGLRINRDEKIRHGFSAGLAGSMPGFNESSDPNSLDLIEGFISVQYEIGFQITQKSLISPFITYQHSLIQNGNPHFLVGVSYQFYLPSLMGMF